MLIKTQNKSITVNIHSDIPVRAGRVSGRGSELMTSSFLAEVQRVVLVLEKCEVRLIK